jgi:hypothetical protein
MTLAEVTVRLCYPGRDCHNTLVFTAEQMAMGSLGSTPLWAAINRQTSMFISELKEALRNPSEQLA